MKKIVIGCASFGLWLLYACGVPQLGYAQGTTPIVVASTVSCATSVDGSVVGLPNPLNPPIVAAAFSGTLPAANYYVQNGWYDAAGHVTLVGPEVQVQLSSTGSLTINLPSSGIPVAAVGMKVYIGASSGAETLQGVTTGFATFTQSTPLATGAAVPSTNTTICAIVANDAGWPTGTGYQVSMTTPAGDTVPGYPMQWQLNGPGTTINLGQGLPYYNGMVGYPVPILARPYNHASQSISGPLSMTGYALTQVLKVGVGTSVPGWPLDVENGAVNASGGFIYDGGVGVAPGDCLVAGSDAYATFVPSSLPCLTAASLSYQTVAANGTSLTQRPVLNFSSRFAVTDSSSPARTNVDLAASGVTAGAYTCANVTVDTFGRVTLASSTAGCHITYTINTPSNTFGVSYQNTNTYPLLVTVSGNTSTGCTMNALVGSGSPSTPYGSYSAVHPGGGGTTSAMGTFLVPPSWFYEVTTDSCTLLTWIEAPI